MTEVTSVVVAMLCMLVGQVTSRSTCGVDARPHNDGICGSTLITARDNLCFLLYTDYPDHFSKRSVNDIFNHPVSSFVNMNLMGQDDDMQEDKLEDEEVVEAPPTTEDSKLYLPFLPKLRSLILPRPQPTANTRAAAAAAAAAAASAVLKAASKRAPEDHLSRHVEKRGMVCDCCFNRCRASVLARYC